MAERYRLSFTTGGLFLRESQDAAQTFLNAGSWTDARAQMRSDNTLQVRTATAALRISKEVVARLETLSHEELDFLLDCTSTDRAHLLWAAVCRRYTFVRDFARDVLRERFVLMKRQLYLADFDAFYSQKALWHEELDQLAQSTQLKLRQNLFRMMREAAYINDQYGIAAAVLSPALARLLAGQGAGALQIYPVSDIDIQRWLS